MQNCKEQIASAITAQGVTTDDTDTVDVIEYCSTNASYKAYCSAYFIVD